MGALGEMCGDCRTDGLWSSVDTEDLFPVVEEDETVVTTMPYELQPRFTGRGEAIEQLVEAFNTSRDLSEMAFMLVIGEPGIGKTRTVKELCDRLGPPDGTARFLLGAGDTKGVPFAAITQALCGRFDISSADNAQDAQEKIISEVAEVLPAAGVTEVSHLLGHLMGHGFADSPVVGPLVGTPQRLESRMFIALRRFLAADSQARPLLLAFENLDLCGPETINLLHYLAAGLASSPAMLLGTARSTLYERHPSFGEGDVPVQRIDLGPLTPEESEQLLRELCAPLDRIPAKLVNHAKALGGSPRALFELVRLLLESNVIVRSGSMSWKIDPVRLSRTNLPDSYDNLVTARLKVMMPSERDLVEKAAVVGETFWLDSVVSLVRADQMKTTDPDGPTLADIAGAGDRTRVAVAQALADLAQREWLTEVELSSMHGEREYRFAYPNLWQTVHQGINDDQRRRYHSIVAQWLELRPEGGSAHAQEDVGRHLELGGQSHAAMLRYRRAADDARAQFFNTKAIRLYARALGCLGDADYAARIHLWHDLGSVYELIGDFEAALGAFERMLRLAWLAASRTKAAVAFNKMGRVWRRKGNLKLAIEYLRRGQDLFEQAGDERGIGASYDDIGKVLYLLGQYDEAFEEVTKGLSRRGQGGDPRSIAQSLSTLGNIQQRRGRVHEASNCHREALELRRNIGDRIGVIGSHNDLAVLAFEHGNYEHALRGWQQALAEAEEIGALPLQGLALLNLGELALIEGRHDEARVRLDDALNLAEDLDDKQLSGEAMRNLALLENALGHNNRAKAHARQAHQIAAGAGLRDHEGRALIALGEILSSSLFDPEQTIETTQRDEPSAADYFTEGIALLRNIGSQSEVARGLELFGRYKVEQGDTREGAEMLQQALTIFTTLGMRRGEEVHRVLQAL